MYLENCLKECTTPITKITELISVNKGYDIFKNTIKILSNQSIKYLSERNRKKNHMSKNIGFPENKGTQNSTCMYICTMSLKLQI